MFGFQDSKLAVITILVADNDWDKVRDDLNEKLGPAAKEVPQVYQNAFGARWEYGSAFWQAANLVVFAREKVNSVGGVARPGLFSNSPETSGIEITITDSDHAKRMKLPSGAANSLD